MKAAFLDFATMGSGLDLAPLERFFDVFETYPATGDQEIADRIRDAEFVFINKFRMTPDCLAAAPKLRFIGLAATGTNNVDLEAAKDREIAVCNTRAYCTTSVVEHVFGVLLMLTHSLGRYQASVRAGEWQRSRNFCMLTHPLPGIAGRTLGIVGFGELGRGVARLAPAFDMKVTVSARPGSDVVPEDRVAFEALLDEADIVSLHCPLSEETRNLIGTPELARMKSSAYLINTARGALVDSAALVAALENGDIAGAAIDVLSEEPPVAGDPLLDYTGENLIVTPHVAWATDAARQNAIDELAANVAAFLDGERRNRVV